MGNTESTDGLSQNDRAILHREYSLKLESLSLSLPQLNIGNRQGNTGYIDFIEIEELTSPRMGGRDSCGRHFLVAKGKTMLADGSSIPFFQTFFQRYTGEYILWVGCDGLFCYEGGFGVYQKKAITELFENGNIDLNDTQKFTDNPKDVLRLCENSASTIVL